MKLGIAFKLSVLLALVGVLAAGLTGFYANNASQDLLVNAAKNQLLTSTQVLARRITLTREEIARNLQVLADHPAALATIETADATHADQVATLFNLMMQANSAYTQIRLISASDHGLERVRVDRAGGRTVRVQEDDLQEKGHFAYVSQALKLRAGEVYLSRISVTHERGTNDGIDRPALQLAMPVTHADAPAIGVVVITVDLDSMFELLATDLPSDFKLYLANGSGDVLIHPDPSKTFGFDKGRRVEIQDEFGPVNEIVAGQQKEVVFDTGKSGDSETGMVAAFTSQAIEGPSEDGRLILGLARPLENLLEQTRKLGTTMLQIVFGLCVAFILLAIPLARAVIRPIDAIGRAADRLSSGLPPTELPLHREDEIGALARSFRDMQDQLSRQLTALLSSQAQLEHLAQHDTLTGLPNRYLLLERLKRAVADSARSGKHGALLFLDLDNFKTLNDTLGHDVGDQLLQQVGRLLTEQVRGSDTVARLGGDEFVVVLEDLDPSADEALVQTSNVGRKLLATLNRAFQFGTYAHHSTGSIGATLFVGDQRPPDELLKQADLAMYQAKTAGRNALRFFDPEMETLVQARMALEADLRLAIQGEQFQLHYQVQVDADGRALGVEALLRWQHPRHGMVQPTSFIPVAEDTGLILPIGQWVIEAACRQLVRWAEDPVMSGLTVAINLSARQLRQPDFVASVATALERSGARPGMLKLELTESVLVEDVEQAIEKMTRLRALGILFSLDDFGMGYSSLAYLKRLPIDELKIDRSFVRDILTDVNDAAIARMVVVLADSLGLRVVAEGVEDQAQIDMLTKIGCRIYQGYLFGQPMPPEAVAALVKRVAATPA
ncbi:bifunctional diguanylate cyclase/phosphodiesterase [Leptothrix sp. BB-4]